MSRGHISFTPIVGTINREEQLSMKRLIFRVSRGKAYTYFFDLHEKIYDYYGNHLDKTIFFVLFPQDFTSLKDRLQRVVDSFLSDSFDLPKSHDDIRDKFEKVKNNIENMYSTLVFTIENYK
jgi:hypothetical protein